MLQLNFGENRSRRANATQTMSDRHWPRTVCGQLKAFQLISKTRAKLRAMECLRQ